MDNCNFDNLHQAFMMVIKLHYQRLHATLEKLGLYPGQPPMLFILYKNNGQSQRELAEKLHIKPATTTVMLTRLEKAGLVTRKQDELDQRISRVYLTDKGMEVCEVLKKVMGDLNEECFGNFSDDEKELLRNLLQKMADNLSNKCENLKDKD
ncbi:putative HTH-type transcriptional regulator YusO [Caloramator mitchellensis]|uniref:Putative HTH-type transcriptional regulator YusO n=1 Tax=Caloramator mitchellensis TaxID=908809 RepID=A0A0R3JWY2_CALMK|nr:MarR family transcriptional regulator [Caloramator mitchellensis]KRQ88055.1 putative HTH-type transcriptional regulator YusO [Caloramator mitchellensis]